MPNNKTPNQNDDNLFTQMFGQPSEQPKEKSLQPEKTNVINENSFSDATPKTTTQSNNAVFFNQETSKDVQTSEQNAEQSEVIELTTYQKEESISSTNRNNINISLENLNTQNDNYNQVQSTVNENLNQSFQTYQENKFYPSENQQLSDNTQNKGKGGNPSAGIILLVILVAFIIYAIVQVNNQKLDKKELLNQTQNSSTQTEVKEEEKTEETSSTLSEPSSIAINFDEKLEFDKGFVDNKNELNKTEPFEPTAKTGIIRCDSKEKINTEYGSENAKLYLYYEDYLLKKFIQVSDITFSNSSYYNLYKKSYETLNNKYQNQDSFRVIYEIKSDNKMNVIHYFNLAYGNKIADNENKVYYSLYVDYNDNIKSALGSIFYNEKSLNKYQCSSIKVQ